MFTDEWQAARHYFLLHLVLFHIVLAGLMPLSGKNTGVIRAGRNWAPRNAGLAQVAGFPAVAFTVQSAKMRHSAHIQPAMAILGKQR
ncbi:hypothetical protein [Chitinilyticum aquatile]|uniref:hypothetical protein n=1 Tax=Chitinilyticum aquatile TaxID=362520 RepID=UPI0012DC478B|nr:hypothetical protein [Chitinilyticum aquatile]